MIIADAERKAALQMLEQLEMILKIVSIYEEQHMHMNKMIDEGKLCCTSWCSCGFCHQAAESTKIVKTEGEACRNLSIEREERERERECPRYFCGQPKRAQEPDVKFIGPARLMRVIWSFGILAVLLKVHLHFGVRDLSVESPNTMLVI